MDLFDFINVGIRNTAHVMRDREAAQEKAALEEARQDWIDALYADETRAWLDLGEKGHGTLNGMTTLLVLACMAHIFDTRSADTPETRIIRGAISAAEQCAKAGGVMTAADAGAFSSAAERARGILKTCTLDAIRSAALGLRDAVGLPVP